MLWLGTIANFFLSFSSIPFFVIGLFDLHNIYVTNDATGVFRKYNFILLHWFPLFQNYFPQIRARIVAQECQC